MLGHLFHLIQRGALKSALRPAFKLHQRQQVAKLLDGWRRPRTRGRGLRPDTSVNPGTLLGVTPRPSSKHSACRTCAMDASMLSVSTHPSFEKATHVNVHFETWFAVTFSEVKYTFCVFFFDGVAASASISCAARSSPSTSEPGCARGPCPATSPAR